MPKPRIVAEVFYVEQQAARDTLDLEVNIPDGLQNGKLLVLYGNDESVELLEASIEEGEGTKKLDQFVAQAVGSNIVCRGYGCYLDEPPPGRRVVRLRTAGPAWSCAWLGIVRDGRAGPPLNLGQSGNAVEGSDRVGTPVVADFNGSLGVDLLVDAFAAQTVRPTGDGQVVRHQQRTPGTELVAAVSTREDLDRNVPASFNWQTSASSARLVHVVAVVAPADAPPVRPVRRFTFQTRSNPAVDHDGVSSRPAYNPRNPGSTAVVDPMSGIEIIRLGGPAGSAVLLEGVRDSGLVFPRRLRNENSPRMQKVINADGTLIMIDRRYELSGEPGNACSSYLVDVTGQHTGAPWRIIRASSNLGLGDGVGQWWMWDPKEPLRAYVIRDDGQVDEWWPIGGKGHATGEVNRLFRAPARFGSHNQGRRHMLQTSYDGVFYVSGCRESNGARRWGGIKLNLETGAAGPFIPTPDTFNEDGDRSSQSTSATGLYTSFSPNGNRHRFYNTDTGELVSDTDDADQAGIAHIDLTIVNGREYAVGMRSSATGFRMFDIAAGSYRVKATFPAANPQHTGTRASRDLFERHGGAGGGTSGVRYAIFSRSNPRDGEPRGIMAVRLGPDDANVIRYICNHRSVRTTNANEVHAQQSPDGRLIVFPSNWQEPGVENDGDVHPYVAVLPESWYSPDDAR